MSVARLRHHVPISLTQQEILKYFTPSTKCVKYKGKKINAVFQDLTPSMVDRSQLCHQRALRPSPVSGTGYVTLEDYLTSVRFKSFISKANSNSIYLMRRLNEEAMQNASYIWCAQYMSALKITVLLFDLRKPRVNAFPWAWTAGLFQRSLYTYPG